MAATETMVRVTVIAMWSPQRGSKTDEVGACALCWVVAHPASNTATIAVTPAAHVRIPRLERAIRIESRLSP